jgi:glucose/arabinose dehydrogenase
VFNGLTTPIGMTFLDANRFFVIEKNTGLVKLISTQAPMTTVLDLAVNFASERGLLSIALHPRFPANPGVYLFWTESSTGADTNVMSNTPLLGNRVDRYVWNGATLTFDRNVIRLRAIQSDAGQSQAGNHNGGVIRFGPDRRLYIFVGDVGRRGQTQNLPDGPFGTGADDDQFGGPEPDDAHLTGVILRVHATGTALTDNPFYTVGASMGGQAGANIQKIWSYGHRNGFGMAFDSISSRLWVQENGDDSFSELNRVVKGMNGGWIQIAGPASRNAQYKQIETTIGGASLQQIRWPPSNIAGSSATARSRLFVLPGSTYRDPDLSWKYEVAPGALGFLKSANLGTQYQHDLFMGAATSRMEGGYLFRFNLTSTRNHVAVNADSRLSDRVADNTGKHNITESETFLFGRNFGTSTDILTGPNGNLFVVSLSAGAIYEIHRP